MSDDSQPQQPPFQRREAIREPGIIGAQWWNDGLTAMGDPVSRRKALRSIASIAGTVVMSGLILSQCDDSDSSGGYGGSDESLQYFDALQMQRERGWDFGSGTQKLAFSGPQSATSAPQALENLVTELTPQQDTLKPYYQATLFQALSQRPPGAAGEPATSLRQVLRPLFTPEMSVAHQQGEALRELFEREDDTTTAVMVDLPGPESVAFAAALAPRFEPVFTFDNWPHPMGVVPAHLTLAAVVHYRDTFKRLAAGRRTPAAPVFVLDRHRLAPYGNPETQFDNRYVARLPPVERLQTLGLKHVLYVVPDKAPPQELDDLNEDFTAYRAAGIDVRLVMTSDFEPDPFEEVRLASQQQPQAPGGSDAGTATSSGPRYYFGGSPISHATFWSLYPWGRSPGAQVDPNAPPFRTSGGHRYVPRPRATMFTGMPRAMASGATARPRPNNNFGMVMMRVANNSRTILGPGFGSYSSWRRSGGSSSYGG